MIGLLDIDMCPLCGRVITKETNARGKDKTPKEGDLAVCIGCGAILTFGGGLRLRIASNDEIADSPSVIEVSNAVREIRSCSEVEGERSSGH